MSLKALIVDDNMLSAKLAAHMLGRLGWSVEATDSGLAALQLIRLEQFDLVLLDLRMPYPDGRQVCRELRYLTGRRQPHVVAYTAHHMPEERARLLDHGFDDVLIKPISFEDVRRLGRQLALQGTT